MVLVTVSRSGCLLELDYGWLIIGARPIYCFGRECVAILIDPPISVDGNKILARVYLPVIWYLVILFLIRVVVCLDSASILSMQVRKYFAVPALIILLTLCSIVLLPSNFSPMIWSIVLIVFSSIVSLAFSFDCFARVLFNCFACNYTLFCLVFSERNLTIFLAIFLSPISFFLWGSTITINSNIRNVI